MKLTPFLRKTQDQIQKFYLDQKTGFLSGLNVGRQTSQGLELEVDKGDFSRNGLAARLVVHVHQQLHQLHEAGQRRDDHRRLQREHRAVQRLHQGRRRCAVLHDHRRGRRRVRGGLDRQPVLQRADPAADGRQRQLRHVHTFPGGVGAGGYSSLSAPYVSTLAPAVEARTAGDHAGASVRGRHPLRRAAIDAGHRSVRVHGRPRRHDVKRSALSLRRRRRRAVRLRPRAAATLRSRTRSRAGSTTSARSSRRTSCCCIRRSPTT